MSLNWKQKVLMVKTETTYGIDAVPTGVLNAVLAQDVQLKPMEGTDVSRDLERPYFGADATIPTELMSEITFDVELAPSGTPGVAPAWGNLLRACGLAETVSAGTSVIYNPITDDPESATIHLFIDGTRYAMTGARGELTLDTQAQAVPKLRFMFKGLFVKPSDQAQPSADLTAWTNPQIVSHANTPMFRIDGADLVMRSFKLALGNQLEGRFLVGKEQIIIGDRQSSVETTVEALPLTQFDPFQRALDQSATALTLVHGTEAGKTATLEMVSAQMQRPQGLSNAQNIKEWPLRMVPLPITGSDEFTLTLT